MDEENVVPFSLNKEGNFIVQNNMDKPWAIKLLEISPWQNIAEFHLHKVSKVVKHTEAESKMVFSGGWRKEEMGVSVQ